MHIDQNLVFIVILVLVGIGRAVSNIVEKSRENAARRNARPAAKTPPPARARSDEEEVRRFLEALGQPAGSQTPPPVAPRTDVPPRPLAPVQPPPSLPPFAPVRPEQWKKKIKRRLAQRQQPASKKPVLQPVPSREAQSVPPNAPGVWMQQTSVAENAPRRAALEPAASPAVVWREALRSPDNLRNAIVLREIFGPPRAFSE